MRQITDIDVLSHLVELEGCPNFRDLGGYSCGGGGRTRRGRFYRADCLSKLTGQDAGHLAELGVTTVVDLRSTGELARAKNALDGKAGFFYHNVSLEDGIQSREGRGLLPESLVTLYFTLADEAGAQIAHVMRILLSAPERAVFHCTAGKDRTGVIAALLLLLAEVEDEVIVADYAATYGLMKDVFDGQVVQAALAGIEIPGYLLRSEPSNMEEFLAHIRRTYGGAAGYLAHIGLTEEEISLLKQELTEVPA